MAKPEHMKDRTMEYCVSLEDSGDLIKDGFPSEKAAYEWLEETYGDDIDGFVIERAEIDS